MAFLLVALGMIAGGTVATLGMTLLLASKNADENAHSIISSLSFDEANEELTENRV